MQGVTLLLVLQHAGIGRAELGLIECFAEALACLLLLLFNLLLVLGYLVLDEHVGAVTLLGVAVVYQRVIECIHVSTGLPGSGVHEDGGIQPHDIVVQLHHALPPILLDVVLQLHAVLSVVIYGAQSIVNLAAGEHETVLLAVGHYLLEYILLLCHKCIYNIEFIYLGCKDTAFLAIGQPVGTPKIVTFAEKRREV